jgi:hypothetical protein
VAGTRKRRAQSRNDPRPLSCHHRLAVYRSWSSKANTVVTR